MKSVNARDRDEFLKALEEARRAAMGDSDTRDQRRMGPETPRPVSFEFRRVIDDMASRVRSYVSARFLSHAYADSGSQGTAKQPKPPPVHRPPKSEQEAVRDELHLTPNLTTADLIKLRREYAKINHPDRVLPPGREQASRRMTIANSLIDEALRSRKGRPH